MLARPSLVYVSDDDADRSARTREEAVSAYGDRILACGHFPGSSFGRIRGRHLDASSSVSKRLGRKANEIGSTHALAA